MRESVLYTTSADYVYRELRNRIITKKIRAGQRLPEVAIAKQLEVSRTPVREALRRLSDEGIVHMVPNGGARVLAPTRDDIENTCEMREYLECLAVGKAASRITPHQIRRLHEQTEREKIRFRERDLKGYLAINNEFHHMIAEASGNSVLAGYVENALSRTYLYMTFYETLFDFDNNPSLEEHSAITSALSRHDEKAAAKLMKDHLDRCHGMISL